MATKELQDDADETAKAVGKPARKAPSRMTRPRISADELHGPSPNVATNLAIADIALRGSTLLARQAVERALLGRQYTASKALKILKGRTMGESLLHTALAKVALRSIPGAIVVGGALVAKTLYDRTKARDAQRKGEAALEEMARNGEADETGQSGA
ncbi:hypothetical protein [Novosphingobium mangrovi (ex Huang et al. 2023)]|uniref:DUF3318 domain-containing protein n=1 Tax=Novosphingobium mangrovi (ex Huang et al. 2023) TaxID=2976432 RepID=A0ABT2HZP7_9SPHN|nr:hypothetical protein [Novosphingobium mangrovi (ex Huang et al. 2023)]MCT2398021.1 hypothetical protein [Novosphingobium mangrovi (ex Huang et al. 2023)]